MTMFYKLNANLSRFATVYATNAEDNDNSISATDFKFTIYADRFGRVEVEESRKGRTEGCIWSEPENSYYTRLSSFFEVIQNILNDFKYVDL